MSERVVTVEYAAQRLGVTQTHIRKFIRNGKLRGCTKLGRIYVCTDSLETFLKEEEERILRWLDH